MIIKVCGLKYPDNIADLASVDVDMLGFIFYDKSPRYCKPEAHISSVKHKLRVGVFVNSSFDEITDIVSVCGLNAVQLHGEEAPDLCRKLADRRLVVIKALPASSANDLQKAEAYIGAVDYILFDTPCEAFGGSGLSFDHSILLSYASAIPFLLSGGLRPDSLEGIRAFMRIAPPTFAGIDLNSGFEIEPGLKNIAALQRFVSILRNI
ncbi:MAG: phosphoribosylanthranilate isomerase [Tannerellaceae bacterium]|jgi:phosphoribosylanthranilate isomerase|nr:phosphoribosylanthranilate isomerase [Tannerellaceae bacterium]